MQPNLKLVRPVSKFKQQAKIDKRRAFLSQKELRVTQPRQDLSARSSIDSRETIKFLLYQLRRCRQQIQSLQRQAPILKCGDKENDCIKVLQLMLIHATSGNLGKLKTANKLLVKDIELFLKISSQQAFKLIQERSTYMKFLKHYRQIRPATCRVKQFPTKKQSELVLSASTNLQVQIKQKHEAIGDLLNYCQKDVKEEIINIYNECKQLEEQNKKLSCIREPTARIGDKLLLRNGQNQVMVKIKQFLQNNCKKGDSASELLSERFQEYERLRLKLALEKQVIEIGKSRYDKHSQQKISYLLHLSERGTGILKGLLQYLLDQCVVSNQQNKMWEDNVVQSMRAKDEMGRILEELRLTATEKKHSLVRMRQQLSDRSKHLQNPIENYRNLAQFISEDYQFLLSKIKFGIQTVRKCFSCPDEKC